MGIRIDLKVLKIAFFLFFIVSTISAVEAACTGVDVFTLTSYDPRGKIVAQCSAEIDPVTGLTEPCDTTTNQECSVYSKCEMSGNYIVTVQCQDCIAEHGPPAPVVFLECPGVTENKFKITHPYVEPSVMEGNVLTLKMDEATIVDKSPLSQTVTPSGSPTMQQTGQINNSVSFDGTDDYLTVTDDNSLDITGAITISFWFKLTENLTDENFQAILRKGTFSHGTSSFIIILDSRSAYNLNGSLLFLKSDGVAATGNGECIDTNWDCVYSKMDSWRKDKWYHILVTWDGTTDADSMKIYLDGELESTSQASKNTILATSGDLTISDETYDFKGNLDEVLIFNRSLSEKEIKDLYKSKNSVAAFDEDGNLLLRGNSPMLSYSFDESGKTVLDYSPNQKHGFVTGANRTQGVSNNGLEFADDSYIELGAMDGWFTNFTVSAWIKPNSMSDYSGIFAKSKRTTGYTFIYAIHGNGSMLAWGNATTGTRWRPSKATGITVGKWSHVVWNKIGDTVKFYVDGTYISEEECIFTDNVSSDTVHIGSWYGLSTIYDYDGVIDELQVFNASLTDTEILELYYKHSQVLHLKMDETTGEIVDYSGYNNTGTPSGSLTYEVEGKYGTGIEFNGNDGAIIVGQDSSINDLPSLTISAWIYMKDSGENGYSPIAMKSNTVDPAGAWAFYSRDLSSLYFDKEYDGTNLQKRATYTFSDHTWYHLAVSWNGGTSASDDVRIYVNGIEQTAGTNQDGTGNQISESSNDIYIGNGNYGARTFNGTIDEVRIFNRALKDYEVYNLYKSNTVYPGNTLEFKNDINTTIFTIDAYGNMLMRGAYYKNQSTLNPYINSFILKDLSENDVSYVDPSGNLYLSGFMFDRWISDI